MHNGGTNQQVFNQYLEGLVSAAAGEENNLVFLMENASCHRHACDAMIAGNHEVIYLPAYSPFLNICENAFLDLKSCHETSAG